MKQEYFDYFDFKDEYNDKIDEIEQLEQQYGLFTNDNNIRKIINKRNGICPYEVGYKQSLLHPDPINLQEVEESCNRLSSEYNGITQIYDGYKQIAHLF